MEGQREKEITSWSILWQVPPLFLTCAPGRELVVVRETEPSTLQTPKYTQGLIISIQYAKLIGMAH